MTTLDRRTTRAPALKARWRPHAAMGLMCLISAPAFAVDLLRFEASASSQRFALPDVVYASGVGANFAGLSLSDDNGSRVDFAICAVPSDASRLAEAPLVAVPDIARLQQTTDGLLQMSFPPGASHPGIAQEWVVDLRAIDGAMAELDGLPAVASVRSSPNLEQWSAPLAFRQDGSRLRFEPLTTPFLRLRLLEPQRTADLAASLSVVFQARFEEPTLHWFTPKLTAEFALNPRNLPITAARARATGSEGEGRIESRQGDWDAWKPRARVPVEQSLQSQRFSRVTDPQWRTRGPLENLELAHTAYEIRIPQINQGAQFTLKFAPDRAATPRLSCRQTESVRPAEPRQLSIQDIAAPKESAPGNLRGAFLILVAVLAVIGLGIRKYRDRGSKR